MSSELKVSVIITTYNSSEYFERCLKSVLIQRYPEMEIIVVDGSSTDGTLDIVRRYESLGILKCYITKGHIHVARNLGIEKASGDIIIFLDADDELMEGALDIVIEKFKECGEKLGVLYAYALDDDGNLQGFKLNREGPIDFNDFLCERIRYGNSFAAFRRSVIKNFKFEVPGYEFMLHKRIVKENLAYFVPLPLLRYHNKDNPRSLSKRVQSASFRRKFGKEIAESLNKYLSEFEREFLDNCPDTYARLLLHMGVLYLWATSRRKSLNAFLRSFRVMPSMRALRYCILAFLPTSLYLKIMYRKA